MPDKAEGGFSIAPNSRASALRSKRSARIAAAGSQFHAGEIQPAAKLHADLRKGSDMAEAQRLMQADGGLVFRLDTADHDVDATRFRALHQFRHQQPTDARAAMLIVHVDRVFDRMAKAFEGAPFAIAA